MSLTEAKKGGVGSSTLPAAPAVEAPDSSLPRRLTRMPLAGLLRQVLVVAAGIAIWTAAVESGLMLRLYAATPLETFERGIEMVGEEKFWSGLGVTLQETLLGWVIGGLLGLVAGLVMGRWRPWARTFGPSFTFLNAMPKVALAPFFILWFGVGPASKVVLAATIVFFIVQLPTQAAIAMVDRDLETVATTMGATELQKFRMVYLPSILAAVFGAFRLGAVYALLAVVMGEFIAAENGLGQQLITATNQFDMPTAFALLVVLAGIAVVLNSILGLLERHLLRWRTASESHGGA